MVAERERLPEAKTLDELLSKSTEDGREFARIIDLPLFYETRRSSKNITIFSDVAGNNYGLDSFGSFKKFGKTGYQYKFYPSPLSASIFAHLADITRDIDAPSLRIAHCIRDLAYGDESRTEI